MTYIDVFEYIGVAAFAVCGAMAGIDRGADIFGVLFVAVITALGGGVIRDMMLGHLPPRMFSSFAYIGVAVFLDWRCFWTPISARKNTGCIRRSWTVW